MEALPNNISCPWSLLPGQPISSEFVLEGIPFRRSQLAYSPGEHFQSPEEHIHLTQEQERR